MAVGVAVAMAVGAAGTDGVLEIGVAASAVTVDEATLSSGVGDGEFGPTGVDDGTAVTVTDAAAVATVLRIALGDADDVGVTDGSAAEAVAVAGSDVAEIDGVGVPSGGVAVRGATDSTDVVALGVAVVAAGGGAKVEIAATGVATGGGVATVWAGGTASGVVGPLDDGAAKARVGNGATVG